MKVKPVLELREIKTSNPETLRILKATEDSIERLNSYAADFIETINILKENHEKHLKKEEIARAAEITENIAFVEAKIREVTESMQGIVRDMGFLVELKTIEK